MLEAHTQVSTPAASRHLSLLCQHFQQKVPANWSEQQGEVDFGIGKCWLQAEPQALLIRCQAADQEALAQVQEVVKSHLEKFARNEGLQLHW